MGQVLRPGVGRDHPLAAWKLRAIGSLPLLATGHRRHGSAAASPLRQPTVLTAHAVRKILQVTDGITSKVFRMLNDLTIEAIEAGAERITDDAIERWRPMINHEMTFA